MADGQRGIEIVLHRVVKGLARLFRGCRKLRRRVRIPFPRGKGLQIILRIRKPRKAGLRVLQAFVAEIQRTAVMRLQNEKPHDLPRIFFENIRHRKEVVQRLAHLLVVDRDKAVVHPIPGEAVRTAAIRLRLGNLVLMVREDQVAAAAMEIKGFAQILQRHRRTFDVPSGPSFAPRTFPRRLARLRGLPKREIHRILFPRVHLDPRARHHIVKIAPAELSVIFEGFDAVIDVAFQFISEAFVHKPLHHFDNLRYRLRNPRVDVGATDIQLVHHAKICVNILIRNVFPCDAALVRRADNLVVHVREILDIAHLIAALRKEPPDHIPSHKRSRVADMRIVVRRDAADVNADLARFQRRKNLLLPRHRVVNLDFPCHSYFLHLIFQNVDNPVAQCGASVRHPQRLKLLQRIAAFLEHGDQIVPRRLRRFFRLPVLAPDRPHQADRIQIRLRNQVCRPRLINAIQSFHWQTPCKQK